LAVLLVGLLAAGCETKAEEPAGDGPKKPSAPIPTTPPHRRPMKPGEIQKLQAFVAAQLSQQHAALSDKCWPKAGAAGTPKPAGSVPSKIDMKAVMATSVEITYQFVFDNDGKMVARDLIDNPTAKRAAVTKCLRGIETPVKIPATARKVQLKVPLTFPAAGPSPKPK
jgi:hypothetical protein